MAAVKRAFQDTVVPVEKSQLELRALLKRYGGDLPSFGWLDDGVEFVAFRFREKFYRFEVIHPPDSPAVAMVSPWNPDRDLYVRFRAGRYVWAEYREREIRRRWRVLVMLVVKPLLELYAEAPEYVETMMLPFRITRAGDTTYGPAIRSAIERESAGEAEFRVLALGSGE